MNDLIQALTHLRKQAIRQRPERVGFGATQTPVEGLGLVTEHIAGLPRPASLDLPDCHGKRVVGVVFHRGHGQSDDQRSFRVEDARREYQKWMNVAHFPPDLRVTVDPDNVLTIWHPEATFSRGRLLCGYHRSAPMFLLAMTSPPCRTGSKRASRCSKVSEASVTGVMTTCPPSTETRTRWSTCKCASRATAAGKRTPRLLPHCLISRTA